MWMRETYKGLMSGIIYARKGDQVQVLESGEELSFVLYSGEKFHVRNEKLSDVPVEPEPETSEEITPALKPSIKKKTPVKTNSKSQLF